MCQESFKCPSVEMLHLYDISGPMINFEHKAAVKYKFEGGKSYKFKDKIKELVISRD
jgi:hypothetical protein